MMGRALLGLVAVLLQITHVANLAMAAPGSWQLLVKDAGVASMHTQVLPTGTVIFLDRTNIGPSHMKLANGFCRNNSAELVSKIDCYAHSAEFTPETNTLRPLTIETDTWCSSGALVADGSLVHTGGEFDGRFKIRHFKPCAPGEKCDWVEDAKVALQGRRWYASNQVLPDNSVIVVGGQEEQSFEFVPPRPEGRVPLPFLQETFKEIGDDQNLYPFLHLLPSGNLFLFARHDSIIMEPNSGKVLRRFPSLAGEPRNYPAQGSSVMFPLDSADGFSSVTVMVCGGGDDRAYTQPENQYPASSTCGVLDVTDPHGEWMVVDMPFRRILGDMILLPNGEVLIINGAQNGSAGWGLASNPVLHPVVYSPREKSFEVQTPSDVPRMYHSTAVLLPSTKILVAGGNTHEFYTFTGPFPTELRVESFSPQYADAAFDSQRPVMKSAPTKVAYSAAFVVTVSVPAPKGAFQLRLANPPFATHSFSQGQRQLVLAIGKVVQVAGGNEYSVATTAPPNAAVAPAGYYMLFPVQNDIPGSASWVQLTPP